MQIEVPHPPAPFDTWLEIWDCLEALFGDQEITDDYQICLTKDFDRLVEDGQNGRMIKPQKGDYIVSYAQLKSYALAELIDLRFTIQQAAIALTAINAVPHIIPNQAENVFYCKEKIKLLTIKPQ